MASEIGEFKTFFASPQCSESMLVACQTVQDYYYMAETQMQAMKVQIDRMFDNDPAAGESRIMAYSHCFAFYTLIRTMFSATERVVSTLAGLQEAPVTQFRDKYRQKVGSIIDIANDVVKHPLDKVGKSLYYHPGGHASWGEFMVYEYSVEDDNYFGSRKIFPKTDFAFVHEYLNSLGQLGLEVGKQSPQPL